MQEPLLECTIWHFNTSFNITHIPTALYALECCVMYIAYCALHLTAITVHWNGGDDIVVYPEH